MCPSSLDDTNRNRIKESHRTETYKRAAANAKLLESYHTLVGLDPLIFKPFVPPNHASSTGKFPKIAVACMTPGKRKENITFVEALFRNLGIKEIQLEYGGKLIKGAVDGIELTEALSTLIAQAARDPPANIKAATRMFIQTTANARLMESYYALMGLGPLYFTPYVTPNTTSPTSKFPKIVVTCFAPGNRKGDLSCIEFLFRDLGMDKIQLEHGGKLIKGAVDGVELTEALSALIVRTARNPPAYFGMTRYSGPAPPDRQNKDPNYSTLHM